LRTILIAGCGNIGYRHLQAVCGLRDLEAIYLIEPDRERLRRIMTGDLRPEAAAKIYDFDAPDSTRPDHFDVIISAVTANVRPQQIEVLTRLRFDIGILEKPLAQGSSPLQQMRALLKDKAPNSSIFVNCARELFPGYVRLRETLLAHRSGNREEISPPLRFEISGNSWGYGSNAIHFIDLFRFLTRCPSITAVSAQLAAAPDGNKRGTVFEEFVGTASFRNPHGDTLQLTCGYATPTPQAASVLIRAGVNQQARFLVDEGRALIHDLARAESEALDPLHVSQATRLFLEDSERSGSSGSLPSLDEAAISHAALFESLELATGRQSFLIT